MSVRVEQHGAVSTVIIDRPDRKNAVDGETARALAEAFRRVESDPRTRAAVLWGAAGPSARVPTSRRSVARAAA